MYYRYSKGYCLTFNLVLTVTLYHIVLNFCHVVTSVHHKWISVCWQCIRFVSVITFLVFVKVYLHAGYAAGC